MMFNQKMVDPEVEFKLFKTYNFIQSRLVNFHTYGCPHEREIACCIEKEKVYAFVDLSKWHTVSFMQGSACVNIYKYDAEWKKSSKKQNNVHIVNCLAVYIFAFI